MQMMSTQKSPTELFSAYGILFMPIWTASHPASHPASQPTNQPSNQPTKQRNRPSNQPSNATDQASRNQAASNPQPSPAPARPEPVRLRGVQAPGQEVLLGLRCRSAAQRQHSETESRDPSARSFGVLEKPSCVFFCFFFFGVLGLGRLLVDLPICFVSQLSTQPKSGWLKSNPI